MHGVVQDGAAPPSLAEPGSLSVSEAPAGLTQIVCHLAGGCGARHGQPARYTARIEQRAAYAQRRDQ